MKAVCKEFENDPGGSPVNMLNRAYTKLKSNAIEGGCTAVICNLYNQDLRISNLGDSGLTVFRKEKDSDLWNVVCTTTPQQHFFNCPYQLGGTDSPYDSESLEFEVQDGDVCICATDGLFDNIYMTAIAEEVSKSGGCMQTLSENLAIKAQKIGRENNPDVRTPFADEAKKQKMTYFGGKLDDVTVIAARVVQK